MKIIIECDSKEIAALALELQRRQPPVEIKTEFASLDLNDVAEQIADKLSRATASWPDDGTRPKTAQSL